MTGFIGWRVGWPSLELSFPLRGNILNKPPDSGLRRNDELPEDRTVAGIGDIAPLLFLNSKTSDRPDAWFRSDAYNDTGQSELALRELEAIIVEN